MATSDHRPIGNYDPLLNGAEFDYVREALRSGWVSYGGEFVAKFEKRVAEVSGFDGAVTVASGTCALQLAFELFGEAGCEVLMPAMTFAAPASVAVRAGMIPVFVDVSHDTWQIDLNALSNFLHDACVMKEKRTVNRRSGRTISCICLVHLWGGLANVDAVYDLAEKFHLRVIHDAAQCFGATLNGSPLGGIPWSGKRDHIVAVTSFNANKIITTGAGGAILANSASLLSRARHISSTAKSDSFAFVHNDYGVNYRLSNINAAIGLAQIEKLDLTRARKRVIHSYYLSTISKSLPNVRLPKEEQHVVGNNWMTSVVLPIPAEPIIRRIQALGIMARPMWVPLPNLPIYSHFETVGERREYDTLHRHGLMLPSGPGLSTTELARVVESLEEGIGGWVH